jgi:hypothetical protein
MQKGKQPVLHVFPRIARIECRSGAAGTHRALSARRGRQITMHSQAVALELEAEVPEVTLWDLFWAVSEVADDEREIVATIAHMLTSGSVRVVGKTRFA